MKTILIADDHAPSRELVRNVIEGLGLRALEASDGIEALHLVHSELLHLAFLDIQMPGMSGIKIMEAVRDLGPARRPTMIALSACAMEVDRIRFQDAGFDYILVKPFSMLELRRLICQLTGDENQTENPLATAAGR